MGYAASAHFEWVLPQGKNRRSLIKKRAVVCGPQTQGGCLVMSITKHRIPIVRRLSGLAGAANSTLASAQCRQDGGWRNLSVSRHFNPVATPSLGNPIRSRAGDGNSTVVLSARPRPDAVPQCVRSVTKWRIAFNCLAQRTCCHKPCRARQQLLSVIPTSPSRPSFIQTMQMAVFAVVGMSAAINML